MKKSKLNFIIDILMFVSMSFIIGIGFLIKFTLIPGQQRWIKYGSNVELYLFGLDRHQWGTIHLIIGFIFLGLLILHIVFHWKLIVSLYKKLIGNFYARRTVAILFIMFWIFISVISIFIKPKKAELEHERGRHTIHQDVTLKVDQDKIVKPGDKRKIQQDVTLKRDQGKVVSSGEKKMDREKTVTEEHRHRSETLEIRGYMTLRQLSQKYDIPSGYLKEKLNIPPSVLSNESLGHLRKIYNFRMSDVERIISQYKKDK